MSDAIAPIVGDTDDPSSHNAVPLPPPDELNNRPVRKTRSEATTTSSRLEHLKGSTIRQHYYPEGGWGWIVCVCAFFIHALTSGLLLSYGILRKEVIKEFGDEHELQVMWLGVVSVSLGLLLSPLIVAFCRRKSTRLTAVFGGLAAALGCLFASFASQMHQVFLSYGIVMSFGLSLSRITSTLMIGQYFKRRRNRVEVVVASGTGCGVLLFSYAFQHFIDLFGWRLGMQAITGMAVMPFFIGVCYRSASLYHPQRRAILHLKNQRKRIKDKNRPDDRPPLFDCSALRHPPTLVCMLAAALAAPSLYAPFLHMVPLSSSSDLVLQLHLGAACSCGSLLLGLLVCGGGGCAPLCQGVLFALCLAIAGGGAPWGVGVPCGGLHYALRMLLLEKIRARSFSRAWALVECSQGIVLLLVLPAIGYLGVEIGTYLCSGCAALSAASLMLLRFKRRHGTFGRNRGSCSTCASQAPSCATCTNDTNLTNSQGLSSSGHPKCQKTISFSEEVDVEDIPPDDDPNEDPDDHNHPKTIHRYVCGHVEEVPRRQMTVIEEATTCV